MSNRTFGIELEVILPTGKTRHDLQTAITAAGVRAEVQGYNHRNFAGWKIITDASVPGGAEVVGPVLRGEAGIAEARKVADALEGINCKIRRTCGFHCHVGADDLNGASFRTLAELYRSNERAIDSVQPNSRRGNNNQYTKGLRAGSLAHADTARAVQGVISRGGSRYCKLNLTSVMRHGTVEFRQHSGTVDADKIENWIRFCIAAVEYSHRVAGGLSTRRGEAIRLTGKAKVCVDLAMRNEGCTADDIKRATGWTKTGGFNNAIRRAGLELRKVRTGRQVRYFAASVATVATATPTQTRFAGLGDLLTAIAVPATTREFYSRRAAALNA